MSSVVFFFATSMLVSIDNRLDRCTGTYRFAGTRRRKPGLSMNLCLDVPLGSLGSMVRINGLFHLLITEVYWGYNPLILTFYDPNFLGHPSGYFPEGFVAGFVGMGLFPTKALVP